MRGSRLPPDLHLSRPQPVQTSNAESQGDDLKLCCKASVAGWLALGGYGAPLRGVNHHPFPPASSPVRAARAATSPTTASDRMAFTVVIHVAGPLPRSQRRRPSAIRAKKFICAACFSKAPRSLSISAAWRSRVSALMMSISASARSVFDGRFSESRAAARIRSLSHRPAMSGVVMSKPSRQQHFQQEARRASKTAKRR